MNVRQAVVANCRKSMIANCAYLIATESVHALRARLGYIDNNSGSRHATLAVDESVAYVRQVFNDYKRYAQIEKFKGRVAEIGPGDNCGVALLFRADGCERVDLLDRFYSPSDDARQARIYEGLIGTQSPSLFDHVNRYYGTSAAAENFFRTHGPYDLIVSRAAFEHLTHPIAAIRSMAAALENGGKMLHAVDLRDHGLFSSQFHDLKFLEVPEWLYGRMTQASGRPNRVLVNKYREALQKAKLQFTIFVTWLSGVGEITPYLPYEEVPLALREKPLSYVRSVRGQFASSFRALSDEDLSVAGLFLVAEKV
jgi:SAM-dependent methyltransferase